jgi:autotransporter-associated beta strand protein
MRALAGSLAALVLVGATAPGRAQLSDLEGGNTTVTSLQGSVPITNSGNSPTCCDATLTNVGPSSTYAGVISDGLFTTGLTQDSTVGGTLTLTGANTYSGPTRVQAGTLMGGAANAFSANSPTTVISGGTLDLGGFNQTVTSLAGGGTVTNSGPGSPILTNQGASSFFTGVINGTVGLIQNSPGNTLILSGNITYSGETTVAAGTLEASIDFTFSASSPTTVKAGGTLDLGAQPQQIDNLNLAGGKIQNGPLTSLHGIISGGGTVDGIGGTTGLVANSGLTTLNTTTGSNTYTGATTVFASLVGSATNAFSASSPTTVKAGGALDLGGLHQTIDSVTLAGGVIQNGMLTSSGGITSNGGVVDGIGGTTGLAANSSVTTLKTTTGGSTYTGATAINGGTLLGGATDAFSAASPTLVNAGGVLDLGGFKQSINTVNLAGGVIQNGVLFNATGITSTGGTLNQMTVSTSGTNGSALHVTGSGAHVNLLGTNSFTTQGAGAFGLYADLGASILAAGTLHLISTNPATAAIELRGNGASIQATGGGTIAAAGDAIEFLGGTSQTATFDNFNIGTTSGNIVFADPSTATITFNNSTVNAGLGYLLNATGGSTVNFDASASTLTGAMATDAVSTSNVSLTNGTVWNLTGPSNVSSLAVTNSVIVFAPPSTGGGFKTLTVGNYVGSGANITLNTSLGGSSSPTDQIVVNGGTATGLTYLTIRNAGGLGAQTTGSGIPVVVTTNGGTTAPNAFALANPSLVVGDYRYSLVDPGGDWYLVSQPTPTQQQVQSSLAAVTKAQLGQIVNNGLLSSILLGATQQVSCSNCASGFGALGSFALGTQGRISLSDRLTAIGGFSYNQWNSSGISVYDAPTLAGALLYDFDNFGSSRPFIEAGGSLTPYESVHGSRPYPDGPTMATGSWTSLDRNLSLFARAGWLARLTPIDEVAAYADLGRTWLDTGGYTEATTALNPYPASVSSGLQALNVVRLGGQYTHLFGDNIEVNVSGAVARGFGAGTGSVANVTDFGPIGPTGLPTSTWFEYGARIGYRVSDRLVVDAFVLGAVGGEVPATAHGGIALRVAF